MIYLTIQTAELFSISFYLGLYIVSDNLTFALRVVDKLTWDFRISDKLTWTLTVLNKITWALIV